MSYDFQGESRQFVQEGNTLVVTFVFALIIIYPGAGRTVRELPRSVHHPDRPADLDVRRLAADEPSGSAPINIYTQIGLVTLIGLISKHGILMVEFANHLQEDEGL